ncbi:MAG: chromosome segregation protein SMC [Thiohalocapsa sp.]
MQVERLRLAGFKSFVEPTELAIEPGLTGIVGPNGCGKSNLVEALRWVMGEGSARRLRGGEMDDVIFAGCTGRPARNLAEVALTIDNSARTAPFAFNDSATIEVARRIARGGGSAYRINGREARARDVQLLFADGASGAHSAALVGQGRIGALIAAKPGERRLLLDEAAGTAGLHARRHEAELKLQAAEGNLARLDDVAAALSAQIEALKKQARQAARYRRLGEEIRLAEIRLATARWHAAAAAAASTAAELRDCERQLAALTAAAAAAERGRIEAETALPALRLAQGAAMAAVTRLAHAREALEQELARIVAAQAEGERRRGQLAGDLAREREHLGDAGAALERLADERRRLQHDAAAAEQAGAEMDAAAAAAAVESAAAESGLQQKTEACAADETRRAALERQCHEFAERRRRLQARLIEAERQREPLLAAIVAPEALAAATADIAAAGAETERLRTAASTAADAVASCRQREAEAADRDAVAERALGGLRAEAAALSRLLTPPRATSDEAPSLLSQMQVSPGFEAAVATLFDGELIAPLLGSEANSACGAGWVALPPLAAAAVPHGARPLAAEITAPAALQRRLAHSFWVEDAGDGWRLQPRLTTGQSLVDRDGHLWRWDGFVRGDAGIDSHAAATAERLRQRNRLAQLDAEIAAAAAAAARCGEAAARARQERERAADAEHAALAALRANDERLARARAAETELSRRHLATQARLAMVVESVERLRADLAELEAQAEAADHALSVLPDPALARTALAAARTQVAAARRQEGDVRAALDRLAGEAAARGQRLVVIGADEATWYKRHEAAVARLAALADRGAVLDAELAELTTRPAAIAAQSESLAISAASAAAEQRETADALAVGDSRLRDATEAARHSAAAAAAARERRAGLEARHEAASQSLAQLSVDIAERFGQPVEALLADAASHDAPPREDAEIAALAARLERLLRERETMGPVNLLAEREMGDAAARLAELQREQGDLTEAIARLRRGIAALDREGRERLRAAFAMLDRHFGELFGRLFGGGEAQLAWSGDDDPLEAGLDIMARPPGKRLQALSLLSGGEQALTAIALIFAVFLTNPAPICVLDEVDAPLDDANVDGFCRLVAEIADTTATRFLVITHHRVTMARMDRLFGVTMAERGVSQLVSVDLARAAELRQSA